MVRKSSIGSMDKLQIILEWNESAIFFDRDLFKKVKKLVNDVVPESVLFDFAKSEANLKYPVSMGLFFPISFVLKKFEYEYVEKKALKGTIPTLIRKLQVYGVTNNPTLNFITQAINTWLDEAGSNE